LAVPFFYRKEPDIIRRFRKKTNDAKSNKKIRPICAIRVKLLVFAPFFLKCYEKSAKSVFSADYSRHILPMPFRKKRESHKVEIRGNEF
jgi:hypothetical protein